MLFLSWISRRVRWVERRALWYPYSRLFFFGIVFKKVLFLEFYKVNCGVNIGFWHISFRKMFKSLTCKRNHDFLSLGHHDENVFYLKDFMTWLSLWDVIRHFCFSGRCLRLFFFSFFLKKSPYRVGHHVERLEIVLMAVCGISFNTRWAPCREFFKNLYHGFKW